VLTFKYGVSNTNVSGLCSRQIIVDSKRKLILDNVFVRDNGLKLEGGCSAFVLCEVRFDPRPLRFLELINWGWMKIRGEFFFAYRWRF